MVFDRAVYTLAPAKGIAVYAHHAPAVVAVLFHRLSTQIRFDTDIVCTEVCGVFYLLLLHRDRQSVGRLKSAVLYLAKL